MPDLRASVGKLLGSKEYIAIGDNRGRVIPRCPVAFPSVTSSAKNWAVKNIFTRSCTCFLVDRGDEIKTALNLVIELIISEASNAIQRYGPLK